MSVIDDIAAAIIQKEGKPGDLNYRNNNPGNLNSGPGMVGTDQHGYAIFPDWATGYAALQNQITLNINRGLTLAEFFQGKPNVYAGYAPSNDPRGANDPLGYAMFVSKKTGIPMDTPLNNAAGVVPSGGNPIVDSNTSFVDSSIPGMATGADMASSILAGDLSSISWFDDTGNFAPTPIAWVITIGSTLMLVYGGR